MSVVAPDIAFHRAIVNSWRPEYKGKLAFDPECEYLLDDVHSVVNEMFERLSGRFLTSENKSPILYFDFIESDSDNARAFADGYYTFVGLTTPLVKNVERIANALAHSKGVWELFDYAEPDEEKLARLREAVVTTTLMFVAFHELGHHMHGHCPSGSHLSIGAREEYSNELLKLIEFEESQADELDADDYAIKTLAENLLVHARADFLDMVGRPTDESVDNYVLTLITMAVGVFLFNRTRKVTPDSLLKDDHPPAPVRLREVMQSLQGWLENNRPESREWIVGPAYQGVMDASLSALQIESLGTSWIEQTSLFEDSPHGAAYLKKLQEVRTARHSFFGSMRWTQKPD